MNRRQLAKTLQAKLVVEYDDATTEPVFTNFQSADTALQLIFGLITERLDAGEEVSIAGFGRWKIRQSPGGMRRNPQTQAMVKVAPSNKVRFYPSSALKATVAGKPKAGARSARR